MDNEFDIAIIGMAGRFPGAQNLDEFWKNLTGGVESITRLTDEELLTAGVSPDFLARPDYVKAAPILEDPGFFDAVFFGFSPSEVNSMDPQHRILLELAQVAMENAACDPDRFPGRIGVFAGSAMNTYFTHSGLDGRLTENYIPTLIFNDKDFLSTRISYKLGLRGPSLTVQTACSTSLVAIHLARQSLLNGESDLALAGAVCVRVPHRAGYFYDGGGVVSPDGHVRAFDAAANGTVFGSGAGIIVMKRLTDALAQGDTIHAVIKGSAMNNDGSAKAGYTAPSVNGQADVIVEALANAGVDADSISFIEAHGSGTPVGDPIEVLALTKAFRHFTQRQGYCALGSVKTNVGHLDAAAGMAGIIKTVLALKHRRLPGTLHYSEPNPEINFRSSPFYVTPQTMEWNHGSGPRRAGVMSTGMGGTNAHVVLEEAPVVSPQSVRPGPQVLVLSAKTPAALDAMSRNLADFLADSKSHTAGSHETAAGTVPGNEAGQVGKDVPSQSRFLADAAYTLQTGRRNFSYRRFVVCSNTGEAVAALTAPDPKKKIAEPLPAISRRPVVFLLPGIGDHYVGMGQGLYEQFEVFRQEIDRCAQILQPILNSDIRELLYPKSRIQKEPSRPRGIDLKRMLGRDTNEPPDPETQKLDQTLYSQPALFCVEYALAQLWIHWGIRPDRIVGHSMGEYVAACLAGVFSLEDALKLVAARAGLAQGLPQGFMLAVMLSEEKLLPLLDGQLSIALINGPNLCVVAGPVTGQADFESRLKAQEILYRPVRNAHAFHSRMLDPIVEALALEVKKIRLNAPRIPFTSNATGTWITTEQALNPSYWVEHVRRTARFSDALEQMWKIPDCLPVEVGPGRTLGVLAMQHPARPASANPVVLSSLRHDYENQPDADFILNTVGRLWLTGAEIKWEKLDSRSGRQKIPLPTYPFERRHYWVEPEIARTVSEDSTRSATLKSDFADWFYVPSWERTVFATGALDEADDGFWLVMGERSDFANQILTALQQRGVTAVPVFFGEKYVARNDGAFEIQAARLDDYVKLFGVLETGFKKALNIVHLGPLSSRVKSPAAGYDESDQESGFYSLLNVAKAIGEREISGPIRIGVVTSQIHEVTGEEKLNPASATILGICGVMPKEYPNIISFSVDLSAVPATGPRLQATVLHLLNEFRDPAKGGVIAYRGTHRWERNFKPQKIPALALKTGEAGIRDQGLRSRGVYLITGGTGGIGLAIAKHLAQTCQARLVLTKKTPFPEKSVWRRRLAAGDLSETDKRIVSSLLEIEALGGEVDVFACEVSDHASMQRVITETLAKHKAIHGVIHAAGVVHDGMMLVKTREVADSVLAPKVKGTFILYDLLKGLELDIIVLFSSIATLVPVHGQSDYCAANAFLDAFASFANASAKVRVLTINWPGWQEVGILTGLKKRAGLEGWNEEMLRKSILTKDGVEAFKRALASRFSQVIVSPQDLDAVIAESNKPLLESFGHGSAKPTTVSSHRTSTIGTQNEIEQALAGIWSAVLGIAPIGHNDNFFDLGGHSLLAMQVVSQIRSTFHVSFSLRYFFATPTLDGMAQQISALLVGGKEARAADAGSTENLAKVESGENPPPHNDKERKPELIRLHAGNSGPELFFLIDEGSLGLFKLAHAMADELPIYASVVPLPESALKASMDNQISALPRLEDLAADHVALILSHPSNGPLILAGHCFGGNLAFEVAQQLQRAGRPVEAVLMLDTWMAAPNFWWQKKAWLQAHFWKLMQQGSLYLWKKSLRRINLEKDNLASRLKLAVQGDFTVHVPWLIIERIYRHALEGYRPQKLASRAMLLISRDDWLSNAYRQKDNTLGVGQWFAGEVEVQDVPGDHVTVLDEQHLPELAQCYQQALEKLQSNRVHSDDSPQPFNDAIV